MKYQILQLDKTNPNVLKDRRLFVSWDELNRTCGFSKLCYKKVYEGMAGVDDNVLLTLEYLFQKFNLAHPDDFYGHSLSISDVVELDGVWYYCDTCGWINTETGKEV